MESEHVPRQPPHQAPTLSHFQIFSHFSQFVQQMHIEFWCRFLSASPLLFCTPSLTWHPSLSLSRQQHNSHSLPFQPNYFFNLINILLLTTWQFISYLINSTRSLLITPLLLISYVHVNWLDSQ